MAAYYNSDAPARAARLFKIATLVASRPAERRLHGTYCTDVQMPMLSYMLVLQPITFCVWNPFHGSIVRRRMDN